MDGINILTKVLLPAIILVGVVVFLFVRKKNAGNNSQQNSLPLFKRTLKTTEPKKEQAPEESGRKLKRPNEIHILKLLVRVGDKGMLLKSIADQLSLDSNSAKRALNYLEEKKLVEMISGMNGNQYYLTQLGKNFCRSKGIGQTVRNSVEA